MVQRYKNFVVITRKRGKIPPHDSTALFHIPFIRPRASLLMPPNTIRFTSFIPPLVK